MFKLITFSYQYDDYILLDTSFHNNAQLLEGHYNVKLETEVEFLGSHLWLPQLQREIVESLKDIELDIFNELNGHYDIENYDMVFNTWHYIINRFNENYVLLGKLSKDTTN